MAHLTATPQPMRDFVPDLPEDLDRLVLGLLEKTPEDRPADAGVVADELARIRRAHYA